MALKAIHESLDEIPEPYQDLYTERDSKFVLTGIEGVKTQIDFDKSAEALRKEKNDHKETKTKLGVYRALGDDPEELQAKLDSVDDLESKLELAGDKFDEEKLSELVEKQVGSRLKPTERELEKTKKLLEESQAEATQLNQAATNRALQDEVRAAAVKLKVRPEAIDDILLYGEKLLERDDDGQIMTRDGVGVTPGMSTEMWLTEQLESKPHWVPDSNGGGAKGGAGSGGSSTNFWSAEGWNKGEQFKLKAVSPEKAEQMAKSAGVAVDALKPKDAA